MKKTNVTLNNEKGFTLVEIIAVLVILGILAAVAVPKYFAMQETGASLLQNGIANTSDFANFGSLGLDSSTLSSVFRDYAGTWAGGGTGAITYTMKNGSTVFTFTYGTTIPPSADGPGSIDVTGGTLLF